MIKVDLITGFLGSGKTTFLKEYASWLLKQDQDIGILENDYGAVNVDMMLLNELAGDHCDLSMVAGGCDPDCHKRRFKTKLIAMGMTGFDRVLIEPSGIFDMDEFFDVLQEEPLNRWYEIGNVIAIVEAGLEDQLSRESEYYLASQIAHAGKIIFSKVQETEEEEVTRTLAHLNRALKLVACKRILGKEDLIIKDWEDLTDYDWKIISQCGFRQEAYVKLAAAEQDYQTLYYMNKKISLQGFDERINKIIKDPECGHIFRIKGFMRDDQDRWWQINATRKKVDIKPIKLGQEIFIVIGENLNQEKIDEKLS